MNSKLKISNQFIGISIALTLITFNLFAQSDIETEKYENSPTIVKASISNLVTLTDMTTDDFTKEIESLGFEKTSVEGEEAYAIGGVPLCKAQMITKQIGFVSMMTLADCGSANTMGRLEKELQNYYISVEGDYAIYQLRYNNFIYEIRLKRNSKNETVFVKKRK